MVRLMQSVFAAATLVMAAVSLAGSPARAFTFELSRRQFERRRDACRSGPSGQKLR